MGRAPYDFSGWATRNNLKCSDGRTIRKDAFKNNDGQTVPLVWNHDHHDPMNVLGHALLENRDEGVYAYCSFNDTAAGNNAKLLVQHGDVTSLSIYANQLKQYGSDVIHGAIREVSLVLAGANPGALIDAVLEHGELSEDSAIIYNGVEELTLAHTVTNSEEPVVQAKEEPEEPKKKPAKRPKVEVEEELAHADEEEAEKEEDSEEGGETVKDVFDTLTEKQKKVVYALIGQAIEDAKGGSAKHSAISHADDAEDEDEDDEEDDGEEDGGETVKDVFDTLSEKQKKVVYALIGQAIEDAKGGKSKSEDEDEESEGEEMKHNVFDNDERNDVQTLSHSEMQDILTDAKQNGSMRNAVLAHGIENIEYLFPDAKNLNNPPDFINERTEWVSKVMNGTKHTPFSRIKTMFADITEADARAKGYIKGNRKIEEVFGLLKRVTLPTTVYKKQKLDRDDVIDITDFDVVAWLKSEMRGKLDEELARAFLIGDGRNAASQDKINEDNIRPIWTDDDLFTIKKAVSVASNANADTKAKAFIRAAIKARKNYRGTGTPTLFASEDIISDCLLMEDNMGRIIYDSEAKLATALRVKEIVSVPVMEGAFREEDGRTYALMGLIVNLQDYNVGADKGGAVNMFDDFDIDYNQMKYLIETRCSGALVRPYSAIALELTYSAILDVEPEAASAVLLGKAVSALQENVMVNDKFIKGTLHYVTGYTGFSGDTEEQSGNYLALRFDVSDGATTTVQLIGGTVKAPVTLDSDKNCVFRITNKNTQKIKVVTTLGDDTITKTFSLAGLEIETV